MNLQTITPTQHEKREWSRMAQAAYAAGLNPIGHRFSAVAALPAQASMSLGNYDAAMTEYREWLVTGFRVDVPYTPETWNADQLAMHTATSMEAALHNACCLAGGWYRRAVTIDFQVTADNDERYMLRPSDAPILAGWAPVYQLKAVR